MYRTRLEPSVSSRVSHDQQACLEWQAGHLGSADEDGMCGSSFTAAISSQTSSHSSHTANTVVQLLHRMNRSKPCSQDPQSAMCGS